MFEDQKTLLKSPVNITDGNRNCHAADSPVCSDQIKIGHKNTIILYMHVEQNK